MQMYAVLVHSFSLLYYIPSHDYTTIPFSCHCVFKYFLFFSQRKCCCACSWARPFGALTSIRSKLKTSLSLTSPKEVHSSPQEPAQWPRVHLCSRWQAGDFQRSVISGLPGGCCNPGFWRKRLRHKQGQGLNAQVSRKSRGHVALKPEALKKAE